MDGQPEHFEPLFNFLQFFHAPEALMLMALDTNGADRHARVQAITNQLVIAGAGVEIIDQEGGVRIGGFGFIETTWHHLRGADWVNMYRSASAAAWGTDVPKGTPMFDTNFANMLRLVGHDMKVRDPKDTGHLNYQIPPGWWVENN